MSVWSGWEGDLLTALGFKHTQNDIDFLDLWHNLGTDAGKNNPIDATEAWAGSTVIDDFGIRDYPTHAAGTGATAKQLHKSEYAAILAALKSGNPYGVSDYAKVAAELKTWGSVTFADAYTSEAQPQVGQGLPAPQTHKGWKSLRHSVNTNLPHSLGHSDKMVHKARNELAQARKVRI